MMHRSLAPFIFGIVLFFLGLLSLIEYGDARSIIEATVLMDIGNFLSTVGAGLIIIAAYLFFKG